MMSTPLWVLGLGIVISITIVGFVVATLLQVYVQVRGIRLSPASRQWGLRLTRVRWVSFGLFTIGLIVVGFVTRNFDLMVLLGAGWFAVSFTLRVASGLILRWAGRTPEEHTEP
jgi:hypothetical protein